MTATAMPVKQTARWHGTALKLHRSANFGEVSKAANQSELPEIGVKTAAGTTIAIDNTTLGVAAHSVSDSSRGGARNHADRESHALSAAQIANLLAAGEHAKYIGLPFNRMITIHWQAAGVPLNEMAGATGRFTDLLSKALARHGSATAWIWVHENGDRKGGHCHLLVHVPANLVPVLTKLQRGWLRRITENPYRKRVIHSKPIGGRLGVEVGNAELHMVNLEAAVAYILKGVCPQAALHFGILLLEPGGKIIGKRCGASQNIGQKARNAYF